MRKKLSVVFIVLLMAILTVSMVACNKGSQNAGKLPGTIDPSDIIGSGGEEGPMTSYLKFSFPEGATSVFYSMYVDEFDISKVRYSVVYMNTETKVTTEGVHGNLSEDMLATDEDKANVKKAGHHQIKVQVKIGENDENKPVYATGSFALHLQDRLAPQEFVSLRFDLKDGERLAKADFGTPSKDGRYVTANVSAGVKISSWDEFTSTFRMSIDSEGEGKPARALESVTVNGKTYSATSDNFPLVIDKTLNGKTFTTKWTNDTVTVNFIVAAPKDAKLEDGKQNPELKSQTVQRTYGKAIAPDSDQLNVYYGYYFAGWYVDSGKQEGVWDEGDTLWNFAKAVGGQNLNLVARWTKRVYSLSLYFMGGEFKGDIANAKTDKDVEILSDEIATKNGFTVIKATSTFGIESKKITRIDFSGFEYNTDYSKYVAKVTVAVDKNGNPQKSVYVKVSELKDLVVKGNGDYLKLGGLYSDYQCQKPMSMDKVDGTGETGYFKWVFNDTDNQVERLARLSAYYTEVVFKDGLSLKADGSIRIDKIADKSVNELIIPKELTYQGATRPVSEISAKACLNLKALTKIDFSEASNLKSIGALAFAHAPNLREIVPIKDDKKMESVGKNVFYGSEFENKYFDNNNGKQFIIIGKILYKFVGQAYTEDGKTVVTADRVKTLDLSGNYYTQENLSGNNETIDLLNAQLAAATTIADGAFANARALETIKFGDNVARIENGAFANLANFQKVEVGDTSKLAYIGESAFDNTQMLDNKSGNYNSTYEAIIIGKVFYRLVDKSAKQAQIGPNIEHIAPSAFSGCLDVDITFLSSVGKIKTIGKGAFAGTRWAESKAPFATVNGADGEIYLVEYGDKNNTRNVLMSDSVTTIVKEAFNIGASFVETIKFGTNVKKIEDHAFRGATAIRSFIFTDVTIKDGNLVGAPYIDENAFADDKGKLIGDARFFFTKEVLDGLENVAANADQTTLAWAQLYRLNKANFLQEEVESVYINTDKIATKLLKKENDKTAFETTYSGVVKEGLVVINNTGVDSKADLDITKHKLVATETTDDKGVTTCTVQFEYKGKTYAAKDNKYTATVYSAIKGTPAFNESGAAMKIGLKKTDVANCYLSGFNVKNNESGIPLFYTTYANGAHKFVYTDISGKEHELDAKIEGFSVRDESESKTATVTVDFYGLGKYKFEFEYAVAKSKISDVKQNGAVSLLLNANTNTALSEFKVLLVGQDGSEKEATLASIGLSPIGSIDTKTLGIKTIRAKYASDNVVGGIKEFEMVYLVVLEADANLFEYEYVDQKEVKIGDKTYAGKVKITKCNKTSAETIVIPATWTNSNGEEYLVSEIGDSAFKGFVNLKAIYLGANIEVINTAAFAGCTALENVYTAQKRDVKFAELNESNFEIVKIVSKTQTEEVYEVVVKNFDGVSADQGILAVKAQYVVDAVAASEGVAASPKKVFNIVGFNDATLAADVKTVYLPDKFTRVPTLTHEDASAVTPNVYSAKSGVIFNVVEYVNDKLTYIGNSAFSHCESLKTIDLTKATELAYIGSNAFEYCGLTNVDLSKNVKVVDINVSAFEECRSLETVTLHSAVKTIANQAFRNCVNLTHVTGVVTVDKLDEGAFMGCDKLETKPTQKA